MLNKIGGLARAIYIVLAIVAGFVAMDGFNLALVLVVLGLIAGFSMPRERLVLAMVVVVALPFIGTALATIPAVGTQLNAVTANLQMAIAGAAASAMAVMMYEMVMDGVMGLTGSGTASGRTAAAAR
jgi:hypothetical protein